MWSKQATSHIYCATAIGADAGASTGTGIGTSGSFVVFQTLVILQRGSLLLQRDLVKEDINERMCIRGYEVRIYDIYLQ